MGKNSAELSKDFEARASEFANLVRGLDDEQWGALCVAENWSVGTTAHHVGQGFESTYSLVDAMLADSVPPISWGDIDAMNAAHAAEFPNPDKDETISMIEQSTSTVAAAIAALNDDALDSSALVPAFGADPLSVRTWIEMVVIGHIGMHQPSIEAATGN